ncbi:two component transcriptional regulator, LytTR family [Granulicatella balaenopterae]|uniref:Two component transcriptional regulator, LytTR family n=1 Tax=Granulicatella balaenopterae TaxID=137733 RepID=A0A1H9HIN4_9LACT|nr:response regulator transcription factor [Granulicatella balaenopterae]SEQ62106.1 two component transcriptional regulator, LytTR family [Granulicatella balaenopterae]
MLKIAMIEDNAHHLARLENIILKYAMKNQYHFQIDSYTSIDDCERLLENEKQYHLYFIDLEIESIKDYGFELAGKIRQYNRYATIAFITTMSEAMPVAFKMHLNATDFIVKDMPQDEMTLRIQECLEFELSKYRQGDHMTEQDRLVYSYQGNVGIDLLYQDIYYIQTEGKSHGLVVMGKDSRTEFYGTIADICRLDTKGYLYKVSRSLLVNPKHIENLDTAKQSIVFTNGARCPISYYKTRQVKKYLQNILIK